MGTKLILLDSILVSKRKSMASLAHKGGIWVVRLVKRRHQKGWCSLRQHSKAPSSTKLFLDLGLNLCKKVFFFGRTGSEVKQHPGGGWFSRQRDASLGGSRSRLWNAVARVFRSFIATGRSDAATRCHYGRRAREIEARSLVVRGAARCFSQFQRARGRAGR